MRPHSRYTYRLRSLIVLRTGSRSRRLHRSNAVTDARTIQRPIDSCRYRMPPAPIHVCYWPSQSQWCLSPNWSTDPTNHLHIYRILLYLANNFPTYSVRGTRPTLLLCDDLQLNRMGCVLTPRLLGVLRKNAFRLCDVSVVLFICSRIRLAGVSHVAFIHIEPQ